MLHLLELAGGADVPLHLGARAPLVNSPERAARQETQWGPISFKGAFDAGPEVRPPHGGRFAAVRPRPADAASFIIDTIERRPDEVTLVAVGPPDEPRARVPGPPGPGAPGQASRLHGRGPRACPAT